MLSGQLKPAQFVSQRELVKILDMPLGAVREMIPRLEGARLLVTVPKRGLQIAHVNLKLVRNAFQVRLMIEREAVSHYMRIVTAEEVDALERAHREILARANSGKPDPQLDGDAQAVSLSNGTEIVAILSGGKLVDALAEGQSGEILLKQTPFYAESGGQVGDTGAITTCQGARFEVADTQKPAQGLILHKGKLAQGALAKGAAVVATVNEARRAAIKRHHTATHLLNAALRKVLATDSIKQAGSYVSPDRLRFDFTWFEALTAEQLAAIERLVTEFVVANAPVKTYEMALKDVPGSGIIAVFDEKYGDTVRVVDTEGISRELCGGTHVSRSGDIGPFRILAETSIAAGVRRIEAPWFDLQCDRRTKALTLSFL